MKKITNLFKGRLNRRNFSIGIIAYFSLFYLLIVYPIGYLLSSYSGYILVISQVIILLFLIPLYIFLFSIFFRRLHDLNWSAWRLLIMLVPLANLLFLFCLFALRGDAESNNYGAKPNKNIRFPADMISLNEKNN